MTNIHHDLRFSELRHLDTGPEGYDITVSGFVFCALFMVVGCGVLLGGFFLGAHFARGLLGAWGVGL